MFLLNVVGKDRESYSIHIPQSFVSCLEVCHVWGNIDSQIHVMFLNTGRNLFSFKITIPL